MIIALLPPSTVVRLGQCNILMCMEVMPELFKNIAWVWLPTVSQAPVHKLVQRYARQIICPFIINSRHDLLSLPKWTILRQKYPHLHSVMIPLYNSDFREYNASFVEMLAIMARSIGIELWIRVCSNDTYWYYNWHYRTGRYFKVDFETKKLFAVDPDGHILKMSDPVDCNTKNLLAIDSKGEVITEAPKGFVLPKAPLDQIFIHSELQHMDLIP
jgi:hypothetical protein